MGSTSSTGPSGRFSGDEPRGPDCYRHPGRETLASCSRCGRPICPDCMTPSPVGMRCPECAGERTKVVRPTAGGQRDFFSAAPVTAVLMALNVLAFIAEIATGGAAAGMSRQLSGEVLLNGVFFGPAVADGEWWRIVTSGFLHLGILHIVLNMYLLYMLGQLLEPAIGGARFAAIYVSSLVAGSLGVLLIEPSSSAAGASGAVFGVMGAALVAARSRGINPWESGIGGLLVLNLIITFAVPGIAKGGHIGGLVGGLIVGFLLIELDESRAAFGRGRGRLPAIAIGTLVSVALFAVTIAVARSKFDYVLGFS